MDLVIWIGVFLISLVLLIKSSDYFTEYSERLWILFWLSSFIIWATIVALWTSLPELISWIYAVTWGGLPEYVVDWAVWSNIANILLVFWIWSIFAWTLKVNNQLIDVDLPFFFISMALFLFFARDWAVTLPESLFLLAFIVIFILYSIHSETDEEESLIDEEDSHSEKYKKNSKNILTYSLIVIVSMVVLSFSAKYFIDSILNISTLLWVASSILTLSVVALGTSLPEVLTSMAAIKKWKHWIALWNVFWSNTFNLTLITWIPVFFWEVAVSQFTQQYWFFFLVIVTMAAIFMTMDNKIQFWEWLSLLLLYLVFIFRLVWLV